jgi:(R,R)-butanediol dehydrogenase/meso-butanediol dehydrogenase/diacetyl reductase/L-iditol 2-dehydrogenase
MRSICYTAPGFSLYDLPKPELRGSDDVLVSIAYCGICGSDINVIKGYEDENIADIVPGEKYLLGHEASAYVEELGPEAKAKGLKAGDKVVLYYNQHCGKCYHCRNGQEQFCDNMRNRSGFFSDYAVLNEQQVYRMPDDTNMAAAALVEPISVVLRGIEMCGFKPGSRAAVSGGGGIGLLFVQLLRYLGAGRLTVLEPVESKRKVALQYGAEYAIDPLKEDYKKITREITGGIGFDVVIECSGVPSAIQTSYDIGCRGGVLELFACYPKHAEYRLSLDSFFLKEVKMLSVFQSPYMYPRALEMFRKIDPAPFLQHIYNPEQWKEAFEYRMTGEPQKVMIRFAGDR